MFGILFETVTDQKRLRRLVELMQAKAFYPIIDRIVPASEAGLAFERVLKKGKLGKILLDFQR